MEQNELMLSCMLASELIKKESFIGLTEDEKVKLTIHLSLCSTCKSNLSENSVLNLYIKHVNEAEKKLTSQQKSEIIKKLLREKK